jgi:hypothetical protein
MEQSWTVDKYDVPSGDLEFWATRRGKMPAVANQNDRDFVPVGRRKRVLLRGGLAVLAAVLIGVVLL